MKPPHKLLLPALTLTLFLGYARPCSIGDPQAVFVRLSGPDTPYKTYAAGRLGVILPTYRPRHLVLAYDYLNGRPLTPQEQSQAIAADQNLDWASNETPTPPTPGMHQWIAAHEAADNRTYNPLATDRNVPGQNYQSFDNCLDDAFLTAAKTLTARQNSYGKSSPDVLDWLRAQDTVFSNCAGDGGSIPVPIAPNAPLWLKQDRAYQIAAANFYATHFDAALTGFRTIAADQASPWHTIAPYLVARTLIRQTTVVPALTYEKPDAFDAEKQRVQTGLTAALHQLDTILHDPALKSIYPAATNLRDLVAARVQPEAQAQVLAQRLTAAPHGLDLRHNLIDLSYILNNNQVPAKSSDPSKSDPTGLLTFIQIVDTPTAPPQPSSYESAPSATSAQVSAQASARLATQAAAQTAYTRWQSTDKPAWLVAALTLAQPSDPFTPKLIASAKSLSPSSPAYTSATYNRLRLEATTPATRTELTTILPTIERSQSRSTINLYAGLLTPTSPTLIDFLKAAPQIPASSNADGTLASADEIPTPQLCGPKTASQAPVSRASSGFPIYTAAANTPLFDTYAATILNQRLPLHILREAAVSNTLPPNLRFQLANATLTRAILLDDPATVAAVTPVLTACQPAFKPVLDRYNTATTPDQRHLRGLFALMSFPSTEPLVRTGNQRSTGFASYSELRDNWWAGNTQNVPPPPPRPGQPNQYSTDYAATLQPVTPETPGFKPALFSIPIKPIADLPSPPFITSADAAEAAKEILTLQHIPGAADYCARQALDWVKAHPNDPSNPDLLGLATRVLRNSPRTADTRELNHQLFSALHQKYPNSPWTKRYKTWE